MATRFVAAAIVLLTLCACSPPDDADAPDAAAQPAPADAPSGSGPAGIARNPDRNPYFGDLHVHTNLSSLRPAVTRANVDISGVEGDKV